MQRATRELEHFEGQGGRKKALIEKMKRHNHKGISSAPASSFFFFFNRALEILKIK